MIYHVMRYLSKEINFRKTFKSLETIKQITQFGSDILGKIKF